MSWLWARQGSAAERASYFNNCSHPEVIMCFEYFRIHIAVWENELLYEIYSFSSPHLLLHVLHKEFFSRAAYIDIILLELLSLFIVHISFSIDSTICIQIKCNIFQTAFLIIEFLAHIYWTVRLSLLHKLFLLYWKTLEVSSIHVTFICTTNALLCANKSLLLESFQHYYQVRCCSCSFSFTGSRSWARKPCW